jgi:hypothetical protein
MQDIKKWLLPSSAAVALLPLLAVPSLAQTFRGSINGTVTDVSGAVIPGVKVTATDVGTGVVRETVSSGAGEYSFNDLPLDAYNIKVEANGFQTTEVTGVQVTSGKIYTLPVKLPVSQTATTVEVNADSLSLDTTTFTQTTVIDSKSLQDMPLNGRDFTQLLGQSASFAGYGNSGSVNGTRSDQLNYTIDGTDNNDLYLAIDAVNQGGISGIPGVLMPIDALDEYSLQTTGNSESGHSPGGSLNVAVKSGTNHFHGSAYYYNRNEALAVNSPFTAPGTGLPLRNQNYGGSIGGPIWKDHTFFFIGYEEQKFKIGVSESASEPSTAYQNEALAVLANAGGIYGSYAPVAVNQVSQNIINTFWQPNLINGLPGTPNNFSSSTPESGYSHNLIVHLDHNFNDRNHLSARWFFGQGYQDAPDGSLLPDYLQVVPSHIQNFNIVYNNSIKSNLTNQVLAGVSYFVQGFSDKVHSTDPSVAGLDTGVGPALYGAPNVQIAGFDQIGVTPDSGRNDITGQISDVLTWTIGKHQIRAGLEYRRAYIDVYYYFGGRGTFVFTGGQGPWSNSTVAAAGNTTLDPNILSLADYLAGYDNSESIISGDQERFLYTHTGSGFAQDSWQATPKLNVNFGLRYDYQQPFYTNSPNLSTFRPNDGGLVVAGASGSPQYAYNSNRLDYSPRIGFSYQPGDSHSLVVRGNFGLYFDQPAGQAFVGNIGIPNGGASGINANAVGTAPVATINEYGTAYAPGIQPTIAWQVNQPVFPAGAGSATGSNVVSIYSTAPNFRTPYSEMFGLNIEQSLGKAWLLNIGYVGSVSRHNLVIQDINQSALGLDSSSAMVTVNGNTFTAQQASRPYFSQYPNFGIINQMNTAASASFNSLQVTLRTSAWHGLSGQFAYGWSHNLDDATSFNTDPQDSTNLKGDWGNSQYDVRNHFTSFLTYDIPGGSHGPEALTRGWELSGLLHFNTGEPLNILSGNDSSGTGEYQDRGSLVAPPRQGTSSAVVGYSYAQFLNPSSFAQPAYGNYGNLRRNQITGPNFSDVDLSLVKNTPIWGEHIKSQFRVEMFNVFNRINLGAPVTNLASGSFGQSVDTIGTSYGAPGIGSGEPFNVQLVGKIIF